MNKEKLIAAISEKAGISKTDAKIATEALLSTITETVQSREKVVLMGFGTFEARAHAGRMAKNPRTGKPVKISARTVPFFRPGKAFAEAVNGKKLN